MLMATMISEARNHSTFPIVTPTDTLVRERVWRLLSNLYPVAPLLNRRTEQRYPFACLAHVTPVDEDGAAATPMVVSTKNISENGVSFFHPATLPYRRVLLSFERDDESSVTFLVDLSWCRFTRQGWYESGGRLLQVVNPSGAAKSSA